MTAPSWRPDIHGAADLVEEVVRIVGLDKVPSAPMPRSAGVARAVLTETQRRVRRARRVLAGRGHDRGHHLVVHSARHGARPSAAARMRWSSPIRSRARCRRCGRACCRACSRPCSATATAALPTSALFEVGQAYRGDAPEDQFIAASGVRAGAAALTGAGRHWAGRRRRRASTTPRRTWSALLAELGFDAAKAQVTREAPAWFHPGRSGALRLGPKITLAHFGELHPETLRALDVAGPVAAFEVFLEALPPQRKKGLARAAAGGGRSAARAPRLRLRARRARCRPAMSSRPRWLPTRS